MSRVSRYPVPVPTGVDVSVEGRKVVIKGRHGSLAREVHPLVDVVQEKSALRLRPAEHAKGKLGKQAQALAGTERALVRNMVTGVAEGYQRKLEIVGVGYRAQVQGKALNLTLGFSHPVSYPIPEGITIETPSPTEIVVRGIDKQLVGQVAAEIRAFRRPEPYKGKGVRYAGEKIVRKETKKT